MNMVPPLQRLGRRPYLERIGPGLVKLIHYRRDDFAHDLVGGVAVATVALPVGVAYAELAGFNPAVGLYSSILPLVAYAIFGTSPQLIIGPDAAACALVAAAATPLAAGDQKLYESLKWLVVDMLPITMIDATGLYTVQEVAETLRENGVVLAAAGHQTEWRHWAESPSCNLQDRRVAIFPTFGEAIRGYWVEQKVEDNGEGFLELV